MDNNWFLYQLLATPESERGAMLELWQQIQIENMRTRQFYEDKFRARWAWRDWVASLPRKWRKHAPA